MLLSEFNVCFFIHVFRSFSIRLSIFISGLRRFVYARTGFNLDGYQTCRLQLFQYDVAPAFVMLQYDILLSNMMLLLVSLH